MATNKELLLPEYHIDTFNYISMTSHWKMISRLLEIFKPGSICEIGSFEGNTTEELAKHCEASKSTLYVVDPDAKELKYPNTVIHRSTSRQFFKQAIDCQFYLVDGDHNYETVSLELNSIHNNKIENKPYCIVLHDIGWPCGRRDLYFKCGEFSGVNNAKFHSGVSLENEELNHGQCFAGGDLFAWGEEINSQTGVLTAVENFLEGKCGELAYFSMPLFYGCGVIYERNKLTAEQIQSVDEIHKSIDMLLPTLSIAEANRLRLLQGYEESQAKLKDQQKIIDETRKELLDCQEKLNLKYKLSKR